MTPTKTCTHCRLEMLVHEKHDCPILKIKTLEDDIKGYQYDIIQRNSNFNELLIKHNRSLQVTDRLVHALETGKPYMKYLDEYKNLKEK